MNLYQINQNGNKYCGPSVVSAVVGIGTKEAAAVIRTFSNRRAVKGSSTSQVVSTLKKFGYGVRLLKLDGKANLRQWAKSNARGRDVHLVVAGNHWILVQGRYAQCGKTIDLVLIDEHPNARTFVTEVHVITRDKLIDPVTVIPVVVKKTIDRSASGERAIHRKTLTLAQEHEISVERDDPQSSIWIYPPSWFNQDDDPYDDEHYCDDWFEAFNRVKEYVVLLAGKKPDINKSEWQLATVVKRKVNNG